jgi:outer membrane protein OmpA-like peptidoglycan-associated protein
MNSTWKMLVASLVLSACSILATAQAKDSPGSKDSPLVSRYPGSIIDSYVTHEFDAFSFPIGPVGGPDTQPKSQPLEGKITRILYKNPAGRSSLEIYRNYETALTGAGFQPIYVCKGDACGIARTHLTADWATLWYGNGHYQFSGKAARPDGDIYVSLHVSPDETYLDLIQVKPMEGGLVVAADLKSGISKSGHVAVYGIHFDTGKADVKPDSAASLAEIAKVLQQDPKLKLYVVGHTDNVGALAPNLDLSQRRAAAVVQSLTGQYHVDAARLAAFGAGPYSPVAANDSDAGRALNRRVELVRQ